MIYKNEVRGRRYFLKDKDLVEIARHITPLPVTNGWVCFDKSSLEEALATGVYSGVDYYLEIRGEKYELFDFYSMSAVPFDLSIEIESDSLEGLKAMREAILAGYASIPDKAIVFAFDHDYPANPPSLHIWDAKNLTIFCGDGERNYPYFDSHVEEAFRDDKPSWYYDILKELED
jgi:hypothetical protein